jgi:hypothetical protein
VRIFVLVIGGFGGCLLGCPTAGARPLGCDDPSCVPGINRVVALGSYCDNVTYQVFATTPEGRVVFCDSLRGLPPRYFRSPPLAGIREFDTPCTQTWNQVAQAPDGLFLLCGVVQQPNGSGQSRWIRADHYDTSA